MGASKLPSFNDAGWAGAGGRHLRAELMMAREREDNVAATAATERRRPLRSFSSQISCMRGSIEIGPRVVVGRSVGRAGRGRSWRMLKTITMIIMAALPTQPRH